MKLLSIKKDIDRVSRTYPINEALTKTDEKDIERLVKKAIKDELEGKIEKLVKDQLKDKATEKLIIQVVKNAMSSLYKTLWIRRAAWLSGVENKEN